MRAKPNSIAASAALILTLLCTWAASAQTTDTRPAVCFLEPGATSPRSDWIAWFKDDLRQRGFIDGENIRLMSRGADGNPGRLADLARELASAGCRMIVTRGTTAVRAAHTAAPSIPIVMAGSADPVAMGFAQSLARPGGNITGVSILGAEMIGKRMELLKQAAPSTRIVAAFLQDANPGNVAFREALSASALALGLQVHVREISDPAEFADAFDWVARLPADAVFLIEDPMFLRHRETLLGFAEKRRLPTITGTIQLARAGALVVYAIDEQTVARETARFVADILRGASPADLPIAQPTRFRLVINLKTASALGLTVPASLIARADEVIE